MRTRRQKLEVVEIGMEERKRKRQEQETRNGYDDFGKQ